MPVVQKYPPANPYALVLDHDYREYTAEDEFLQQNKVCHQYGNKEIFYGYYGLKITGLICIQL